MPYITYRVQDETGKITSTEPKYISEDEIRGMAMVGMTLASHFMDEDDIKKAEEEVRLRIEKEGKEEVKND